MNNRRINYVKLAYEVYGMEKKCEECGFLQKVDVHHKDENKTNNKRENLKILCRRCHTRHHSIGNKNLLGYKWTEEQKDKIRGKIVSEETRKKLSIKFLGRKISKEWIEKIRVGNIGKKRSEETKKRISQNHRSKKHLFTNS